MTVVFANGSIANVSSTSNPDLYWGMRGAGHNFGIVTEANIKIYDPPTRYWFRTEFIFEGTQLERVFEHINDFDQPKEYGYILAQFAMNPQYSKTDVGARKPHDKLEDFKLMFRVACYRIATGLCRRFPRER